MASKTSQMPNTTEDLVELSNFVIDLRDSTLLKTKEQIRIACDYIMFLFEYMEFDGKHYPPLHQGRRFEGFRLDFGSPFFIFIYE